MKHTIATLMTLLTVGCGLNPVAPLKDGDQFICKTQIRTYTTAAGVEQHIVDYYAQSTPCPVVSIQ